MLQVTASSSTSTSIYESTEANLRRHRQHTIAVVSRYAAAASSFLAVGALAGACVITVAVLIGQASSSGGQTHCVNCMNSDCQ